jgi:hypothetical protein
MYRYFYYGNAIIVTKATHETTTSEVSKMVAKVLLNSGGVKLIRYNV